MNTITRFTKATLVAIALCAALPLLNQSARGQNASWSASGFSDWDFSGNWTPSIIPTNTATFSGTTALSLSRLNSNDEQITTIVFTSGAQSYTIDSGTKQLTIDGTGVINNSGTVQYLESNAPGNLTFQNGATSGSNVVITNNGSLDYNSGATVGFATINNTGSGGFGGVIQFTGDNTTGGSGTINNMANGSNGTVLQVMQGAGVGNAVITNSGSLAHAIFYNDATGNNATLINSNDFAFFDISYMSSGSSFHAATIQGNGAFYLGSSDLIINGGVSGSFSGLIADGGNPFFASPGGTFTGGSITKNGTADLSLSGSNTFTGGVNLNAGSLFVDNNHALGTGTLTITGGTFTTHIPSSPGLTITNDISVKGDFAITPGSGGGNGITFAGNIDLNGTTRTITNTLFFGGIFLDGAISNGAITFNSTADENAYWIQGSGTNTYTGLTTVTGSAEVLLARSGQTNQTILGDILVTSKGVLMVDFSNQIADTSNVTVDSPGNVTSFGTMAGFNLLGNNETIGTLSGTGLVNLQDQSGTTAGALTVGGGTFSGVISDGTTGAGRLVKTGTDIMILAGANTYTGSTVVNGGLLQIDGTIASGTTLVNAGGTLGGIGFINGNVINNGNVAPGDSPGTLTIAGNYQQNAGGTLTIQISGTGAGEHDLLSVGGNASLAGKLQLVQLNNFALHPGDKVTFLTTGTGTVSGKFSNVDTGSILNATVVYDTQDASIEFSQGSFAKFASQSGLTLNQLRTALNLDAAAGDPRAATLITYLNNQPLGSLPGDFDLISPDELTALFQIAESFADTQGNNIEGRLDSVRSETGDGTGSFLLAAGQQTTAGFDKDDAKKVATPSTREHGWDFFLLGNGDFVHVASDGNGVGYNFTTGGVTVGGDYRVCDHFVIGLMGGYANTGATTAQNGSVDVDGGRVGIYSTTYGNGFYLNTLAAGGYNSYDTHRTGLLGTATGSTEGAEFDGLISGGYDFHAGNWTIGPVASAQYTYVSINHFTENGSLAPLNIPSQNQDSFRTKVGFRTSSVWKLRDVAIIPTLSAEWQHEYGDTSYALDSSFANGAGTIFTANGPALGRDAVVLNAGVNVQWTPRFSTFVSYYGELGRKNYQLNSVSGGLSWSF